MEKPEKSFINSLQPKVVKILGEIKADKKTFIKAFAVFLTGPLLASAKMQNTGSAFLNSSAAHMILLFVLLSGVIKVARLNPKGWLWLGTFCYINAFAHPGITAWLYLILSILSCWVYFNWKSHAMGK